MIINKLQNIFFIGIGGIGMSGIAEVLHEMGFGVSGSDISNNSNTNRLENLGIKIKIGHSISNVKRSELVVYSSAIRKNNCELVEAKKLKIPILSRANMLAEIMRLKSSITIAGSHGKTTTTSLMACIMENSNFDPTVINGGIINSYNTNAKLGKGNWVIAEADESDGSFTLLPSTVCVINNIDPEHLDFYKNFTNLKNAFLEYAKKTPFYGFVAVCIDDPNCKKLIKKLNEKKVITYGLSKEADISCKNKTIKKLKTKFFSCFDVIINLKKKREIKNIKIPLIGDHNVCNTLATITVAINLGLSNKEIRSSLAKFKGVKRRFTLICETKGIKVFDDYAHHPKEIVATLSALKKITSGRIIAIHEPHRYSRLNDLFNDFTKSFNLADKVFFLPVFPAGEKPIKNISSNFLLKSIKKNRGNYSYVDNEISLHNALVKIIKKNDCVIFLGAGPISKLAYSFARKIHS